MKILMLAALASIAIDVGTATDNEKRKIAWIEGIYFCWHIIGFAILTAVMISVNANAVNDYQKER